MTTTPNIGLTKFSADDHPDVDAINANYDTIDAAVQQTRDDLAAIDLVPGPQGEQGDPGPAGAQGVQGVPGAAGKSIRHGAGAPADGTGVDGEFYIDTDGQNLWGPKNGGTWVGTGPVSIKGDQGDPGATGAAGKTLIHFRDDVPTSHNDLDPPANDDFVQTYVQMDTVRGTVWLWDTVEWTETDWAIAGADGAAGAAGADGADGAAGTRGSKLFTTTNAPVYSAGTHLPNDITIRDNGDVYQLVGTSWGSPLFNIKGDAGGQGNAGVQGDQGDPGADAPHHTFGFVDLADAGLGWNDTTRAVTLTPSGVDYTLFVDGTRYTKTGGTTTIPDVTGLHYVYYNAAGALTSSVIEWDLGAVLPVAIVLWNAGLDFGFCIDKRASIGMGANTRRYISNRFGATVQEQIDLTADSYAIQPAVPATEDNTPGFEAGVLLDADLQLAIGEVLAGGPYNIFLLTGTEASPEWTWELFQSVPYLPNATYIDYNAVSLGSWSVIEAGSPRRYVNYWVFAWGELTGDFQTIVIAGQRQHSTRDDALNEEVSELFLTGLPLQELVPLHRITWETDINWTGTPGRCRISAATSLMGSSVSQGGGAGGAGGDHNLLAGRDSTGSHPDTAIAVDPGDLTLTDATDLHGVLVDHETAIEAISDGVAPIISAALQSMRFAGHSLIDTGSLSEGGNGQRSFRGYLSAALGVPSSHVDTMARVGSTARFANYVCMSDNGNPGPNSWPHSPFTGLAVLWWAANDTAYGDDEDGWVEHSYKQAMIAAISRLRSAAVFENTDASCTYSGTWTNQLHESTDYNGSGSSSQRTTVPGSKVTIATPADMGRHTSGVWVAIGLLAGDQGAQGEVWLDGVKHGDLDFGLGAAAGTAYGHGYTTYFTCVTYRMWIPTVYVDGTDNTVETHSIELRHVANVGGSTDGLLFDYWAIEAWEGPPVLVINTLQPADPDAIGGNLVLAKETYNRWILETLESILTNGDGSGVPDPLLLYVDADHYVEGDDPDWVPWANKRFYITDGLHLSEYGGKVVAEACLNKLRDASIAGIIQPRHLLGVWNEEKDALVDPPSWTIAAGTPAQVVDEFDREYNELTLGADWISPIGTWGVDHQEQAYVVDPIFAPSVIHDDFTRITTLGLGPVDFDALNISPQDWVNVNGTFNGDGTVAKLTAKHATKDNFSVVDLASTVQTVECYVLTGGAVGSNQGIVFRYQDDDNYLAAIKNGLNWLLYKRVDGGALSLVVNPIGTAFNQIHVEVGSDDIVHFWTADGMAWINTTYTITDAVLQAANASASKVGLYGSAGSDINLATWDRFRAGTTVSSAAIQSATLPLSMTLWETGEDDRAIQALIGGSVDGVYVQTQGSGFVFRYQDELNYYKFVSTIFGMWYLYKVEAGLETEIGHIYLGYGTDRRVAVRYVGSVIEAYMDGVRKDWVSPVFGAESISDSTYLTGSQAGFISPNFATGSTDTRWRTFEVGSAIAASALVRGSKAIDITNPLAPRLFSLSDEATWSDLGAIVDRTVRPIVSLTGASNNISDAHAGRLVEVSHGSATQYTILANATEALPVETEILITQVGAGQVEIVADVGVTIRSLGSFVKISGQWGQARLYQRAIDDWVLSGDLSA